MNAIPVLTALRGALGVLLLLASAGGVSAQARAIAIPACEAAATSDQDADALSDPCELALAQAFAPVLAVRSGGCNWDTSTTPARLGGAYLFAASPDSVGVRVAYLPAYFLDCGWRGAKCLVPWVDCSPHAGDSELIVVQLQRDPESALWRARGVFLSAHCFSRSNNDCRWFRGADLADFAWEGVAPMVWVSEGRQANYPTQRACDRGHYALDSCDRHDQRYVFPIAGEAQNIGSAEYPNPESGCITGRALNSGRVQADAIECPWTPDRLFRGWQGSVSGVTGYWRYLVELAGMSGGK